MKVYTKVVIDMGTMVVLEEESYGHDGPIAECKGGGSSTTNTVDKEYNSRMATLSEEQQDWAREYFNFWQGEQKPLESAQIASDLAEVEARQPVISNFYQQSLDGVDVEARADRAGADVQHTYDAAKGQMVRDTSRLGINPNSGKMATAMTSSSNLMAKDRASAMNTARTDAQDENYKRLATAMGMQ